MTQFVVFNRFTFSFFASTILLINHPADLTSSNKACPPGFNIIDSVWYIGNLVKEWGAALGRSWEEVREE